VRDGMEGGDCEGRDLGARFVDGVSAWGRT